jgi:hypothetical protein
MFNFPQWNKINEGRYDRVTGLVTREIMRLVRASKVMEDVKGEELDPYREEGFLKFDLGDIESPGLSFSAMFYVKRAPVSTGFAIEGFTYAEDFDQERHPVDENFIAIILTLDPEKEPGVYNRCQPFIRDAVRHEIEHLTQKGINKKPFRPRLVSKKRREEIGRALDSYAYFTLPEEIPAMVSGMYNAAKTRKLPLDVVLKEYLQYYVDETPFTIEEARKVLAIWLKWAKKNLPAAKYSENPNM